MNQSLQESSIGQNDCQQNPLHTWALIGHVTRAPVLVMWKPLVFYIATRSGSAPWVDVLTKQRPEIVDCYLTCPFVGKQLEQSCYLDVAGSQGFQIKVSGDLDRSMNILQLRGSRGSDLRDRRIIDCLTLGYSIPALSAISSCPSAGCRRVHGTAAKSKRCARGRHFYLTDRG